MSPDVWSLLLTAIVQAQALVLYLLRRRDRRHVDQVSRTIDQVVKSLPPLTERRCLACQHGRRFHSPTCPCGCPEYVQLPPA
jgi:hypothetical protein